MKKNNLILLAALASVSCSRNKDYPTLFSKLEKKATVEDVYLQRQLANDNDVDVSISAGKCLKDVFSVEMLRAEVTELEKKYTSGTKVQGKWKHLDLSQLPIPQGNFLKRFGSKIGDMKNPDSIDYSSCEDVPCIFNKIYGKEESPAGYVHYIWYLKMDNLLVAANTTYGQLPKARPGFYNDQEFPLSAYLYRDKEIYAFWRLSHMMKPAHTNLKDFQEIYRVPQGQSFDFEYEKKKAGKGRLGETCGLAYSSGFVILQDLCLTVTEAGDEGEFYQSVLHEISHQLDYHEGDKIKKMYVSDQPGTPEDPGYLDVSDFERVEHMDAKGNITRNWEFKGAKRVSAYAETSPAESFAETVAAFRVTGDSAAFNTTQAHYDWVSRKVYDSGNFERKTLVDKWLAERGSAISQHAFKAVSDCTKSTKLTASTLFKKTDFEVPVLPTMMTCLGTKASEITAEIATKIKVTEPDGCMVIFGSYVENLWNKSVKSIYLGHLNKYLREVQKDKTYFAKIQSFVDQIPNKEISNEAYLSCSDVSTEQTCYEETVRQMVLEKLAPLNLPVEHAKDLAKMYLSDHPFSDTSAYFKSYYSTFVASHRELTDLEAENLYEKCLARPLSDVEPPKGSFFSVNGGYMASSLYNCLNAEYPEAAKLIVRSLAVDEMTVQHPKEEVLLYNEVLPELEKSLESLYAEKKEAEAVELSQFIEADQGKVRKLLLSDFDWVKNVLNSETIAKDCQALALSKVEYPLRYQTKAEAFKLFAQNSCLDIEKAPEYNAWLEASKEAFADKTVNGLELMIVQQGRIKARECISQYPMNSAINRIRFKSDRDACLINGWPDIEAAAVKQLSKEPIVMRFKVDMEAVRRQLDTNRRRLQLRVMKENF